MISLEEHSLCSCTLQEVLPYLLSSCPLWGISSAGSTGTGCGGAGPRDSSGWPCMCRSGSSWRYVWRSSYILRMWTVRSVSRWICPRTRCTRSAGSAVCPWTRRRTTTRTWCCCSCCWARRWCWTGWPGARSEGQLLLEAFPEEAPGSCVPSAARVVTEVRPGTRERTGAPGCHRRPRSFSTPPSPCRRSPNFVAPTFFPPFYALIYANANSLRELLTHNQGKCGIAPEYQMRLKIRTGLL